MSDQPCKTPIIELARKVPAELRGEWEIQWAEDGTPTGHAMAPIGQYLHDLADALEAKDAEIERLRAQLEGRLDFKGALTDTVAKQQERIKKLERVRAAGKVITVNTTSIDIRGDCCLVKTDWLEELDAALAACEDKDND